MKYNNELLESYLNRIRDIVEEIDTIENKYIYLIKLEKLGIITSVKLKWNKRNEDGKYVEYSINEDSNLTLWDRLEKLYKIKNRIN
jgi:hypothetical protein